MSQRKIRRIISIATLLVCIPIDVAAYLRGAAIGACIAMAINVLVIAFLPDIVDRITDSTTG